MEAHNSERSKHLSGVIREVSPLSDKDCFYIADRHKTEFTYPIHTHAEFELNMVERARGVLRIVGDSAEVIGDYDLVLITGKELEHVWMQHECTSMDIREITIQFSPDLLNGNMLNKNQFDSIRKMFEKARNGLSFPMSAVLRIYTLLDSLSSKAQEFDTIVDFMRVLHELSLVQDSKQLSSYSFANVGFQSNGRQMQLIQNYIYDHYREEIRIRDVAELVKMSPVSFSRFFKLSTGKTFTEYLIDIRLGFAARLLIDTPKTILEICYDCGFNNISHFNRVFKRAKRCTPKSFRANYKKYKRII